MADPAGLHAPPFGLPAPGEATLHLLPFDPAGPIPEPALAALHALLEPEEAARNPRFHHARDRRAHLLAHALLQRALRAATGRPRCPLARDAAGKPHLAQPPASPLWFNISHTAGMVACALARAPIGVDVEPAARPTDWRALAHRFFAPAEVALLERAPSEAAPALFTAIWTLKEAVIKAAGLGLQIPLDGFAVDPRGAYPTIATADPVLAGPWWLHAEAMGGHRAALAVRTGEKVALRRVVLGWEGLVG